MAGFTTSKANSILRSAVSEEHYIGLSTTTPNDNGGNVSEPASDTGYARKQIGTLDYSIDKQIANKDYIFIFECLKSAGTAVSLTLSANKTGAIYFSAPLATSLPLNPMYVPLIRPWKLKIGMDKETLETYPGEQAD